jgi:phage-related minor tail protein
LAEAHRRYIREGYLTELKLSSNNDILKTKQRYFILFNDLLIETKPKKSVLDKLAYVKIGSQPKEDNLTQKMGTKLVYIKDIKLDFESVVIENQSSPGTSQFTFLSLSLCFVCVGV